VRRSAGAWGAPVGGVAARYRDEIVRQSKEIQRSTASSSVNDTAPQVRMHLTDGRMEALIRYPVHVEHAAEIDEEVSEAVLRVIAENTLRGP